MKSLLTVLLAGTIGLAACDKADNKQTDTTTTNGTAAQAEPEEKVELTFAFQPQENPEGLMPDAKKLAEFVSKQTGYDVEVMVPSSYAAVVEAMRGGNAQVAYFSGWPYLKAHMMADASLLLVEERNGQPFYHSQWYVQKDSKIEKLSDLKGKKIAFTSPTSTSGFLFPYAELIKQEVVEQGQDLNKVFGNVFFAGGYEAALKSVASGKVDAAAASDYALELYLTPEEQEKVRVLTKMGPVPTHGFAVRADMKPEVREKVKNALLELNKDENKELLKSVYGAEKLVERSHGDHVMALQEAQDMVGTEYPIGPSEGDAAPKAPADAQPDGEEEAK